ncbi:MFS transporter [Burkholderia plantarii]|uniref:MFS transporter n=1 Tax=Burkholderia plantarii TaxID=41899 RepID=UPI0018DBA51F|nr:MFS transporter [Burkholderia plantarii]MBI0331405.1 MFS transporter [Burkholderia plantarii]
MTPDPNAPAAPSAAIVLLMALSCGLVAASSYFAQPLLATIARDVGLPGWAASWIVTSSQLGYCAGLLVLAPLGDCIENRRLVLLTLGGLCVALLAMARATGGVALLAAAFATGLGCTLVQMLVPLAARMAGADARGRVVGNVTSGLLAGIMLARPAASVVAAQAGWRALYVAAALVLAALGLLLARVLPRHAPAAPAPYRQVLGSLHGLLRWHAPLRRLGAVQACLFGAFSLFWGAAPLALSRRFGLSPDGLALFALAGAAGALAAPLAGRAADRGRGAALRALGIALVAAGFALTLVPNLAAWVAAALMIDAGVQVCHVIAQRNVLSLDAVARNRLNSLYIAMFFFGGALGSALASAALAPGWPAVAGLGVLLAAAAALIAGEPAIACAGPGAARRAARR